MKNLKIVYWQAKSKSCNPNIITGNRKRKHQRPNAWHLKTTVSVSMQLACSPACNLHAVIHQIAEDEQQLANYSE